jgi:hypothetical protein
MASVKDHAFFELTDDGWFVGRDGARGPWSEDACHGGPPTGLLARAFERAAPDRQLVRLTVDLQRPVPMSGFRIEVEVRRAGRQLTAADAQLLDRDGRVCAVASGLMLRPGEIGAVPNPELPALEFDGAEPAPFPFGATHDLPRFSNAVELAFPRGRPFRHGPNAVWMRTPPLLADEPMSPFQSVCPLADCGNALSSNLPPSEVSFINPDLTVVLHRLPVSEWIGAEFSSQWQPNGIGLASALLFDTEGAIGSVLQTLLLQRING